MLAADPMGQSSNPHPHELGSYEAVSPAEVEVIKVIVKQLQAYKQPAVCIKATS